ncbi:extracellular solute-binding protein [Aureimonas pseudogalii]|uniref:Multiple sugar transport system substrate-binding protein n=1 Tax=Aureimonas pseudogalii TaxID=1744844 RepID=A0A7W6E8I5_9HYPH|nr:extracellular solute-binding protein [Aureimonas pseudogalii]MBB3996683.1 multiple sugar transport system substrate-binding protein [Aureimonas pseudogalii]
MRKLKVLLAASMTMLAILPAQAAETVALWDFFVGGDGVRMKALLADFNKEHPDIKIEATSLEWGVPFYTKVRTSAAVGQGPDVMSYHLSRLPLALTEKVLTEVTPDDLAAAGLKKEDFFPNALEAASDGGKLYAVPFDIHSVVLYYNKTYLKGTEFLDANGNLTGITDLASFEKAMAAAKEKGSATPLTYATGDDGGVFRVFYTLLAQQGGELITNGNEVLTGDNEAKATKAVETMTRWHEQGWQPEQALYPASVALFTSGQSAFSINGVWEVPTMKDLQATGRLGFEWGAVEVPNIMGQQATWADSHAFAIPVQGDRTMSPEKRKAVMTFIGWMEKNSLRWAEAGHIPAYKPVAESAEYKAMQPNATYAPLAETAVYDPRSKIAGVASPVYDAAVNIISPAIHGYMPAADAVAQMKSDLQGLLN